MQDNPAKRTDDRVLETKLAANASMLIVESSISFLCLSARADRQLSLNYNNLYDI
jgi:hypothetical protein